MSAYMLWLQDVRKSIKEENPGISVTEVSKKAGAMWKVITSVEKKVINLQYPIKVKGEIP